MILKPYFDREEREKRRVAGRKAERQMAHYLDRQFRTRRDLHVLHDVWIEHEREVAQMDHLVVHRFGIAIVESKSVSTSVRINAAGEWERQWDGRWRGMPDPILQGERQGLVLKRLLAARQDELLDKVLGVFKGTFGFMALDTFAAISDDGTIRRAHKRQASRAMKADAIPKAIEELVASYRRDASMLNLNLRTFAQAPRDFSEAELLRIGHFLRVQATDAQTELQADAVLLPSTSQVGSVAAVGHETQRAHVVCKHCGGVRVEARVGSYGPYAKCRTCGMNTAVRISCDGCGERVRLAPKPDGFDGACACGRRLEVRFGAGAAA